MEFMENIAVAVKDKKMTVTVDLAKEFGPSKTGKTIIVANSHGFQPIGGVEERMNLTVTRKNQ